MRQRAEQIGLRASDRPVALVERGLALLEAPEIEHGPGWDAVRQRAHFDLLRWRGLVLSQRVRELEQRVSSLADESRVLHDGLWDHHERTSRLKVRLGRRKAETVRPESASTIGGGGGRRRRRAADRLLAGLTLEWLDLLVSDELAGQLTAAAARRGWTGLSTEDALVLGIALGLTAAEREHGRSAGEAHTTSPNAALEALAYRVFELQEALRILEIRQTAFRIDNAGMRLRLAELQREVADLEREVDERAEARPRGGEPDGSPSRWLGRLLRRGGSANGRTGPPP
jgi:hypothetical protein